MGNVSTVLTVLDLVVLVLVGLAAWAGWRLGASTFLVRLVGVVVGLILGLELAGVVASDTLSPITHLLVDLACAVGGALIGSALGGRVGCALARALQSAHLRVLDRILGAIARGLLALLAATVVATLVVYLGPASWAGTVQRSALLDRPSQVPVAGALAASIAEQLRRVAPRDVAGLVPAAQSQRPTRQLVRRLLRTAGPSVLPVTAGGCGSGVTGTGFLAASGLVVTNAHVVRGARAISVGDGSPATPVLVDRRADLAVLRSTGLGLTALPLASADAVNGNPAVLLGYPGGGPFTATPATVDQRLPIPDPGFSDGLALHVAYRLSADVRHGNSGSPLLDRHGRVIGVVNSLAGTAGTQGYATTISELRPDLAAARTRHRAVATGDCAN